MVKLSLPSNLLRLAEPLDTRMRARPIEISMEPGPWDHFTAQLQARFPDLAARVLTDSGELARGFALVVNGRPARDSRLPHLEVDDDLAIIPYIAGG
jgi:hypothetical protein